MTDEEIINALGGNKVVCEKLERTISERAVANWKMRGIPWHWRPRVQALAKKAKLPIPDDFLYRKVK